MLYPFFFNTVFNAWKISTPQRKPSLKEEAPVGTTMNSWKSILLSACTPPLRMFIKGTGKVTAFTPPRYLYKLRLLACAAAFATAMETASVAFAPSFALLCVPSISINILSINACSVAGTPINLSAMMLLTLSTAFNTPFPT